MKSQLGNTLFWIGLVGALICILYAIDTIWVHESGKSLLPLSGRFASRGNMFLTSVISVALAVLSWGAGVAARFLVNKLAEKRAAGDKFW